ncbi:hypothetical protein K1719_001907 [Acacia pycnantha]|nr:hypothetical protein K1719_001907 [Acacia pycnantha]
MASDLLSEKPLLGENKDDRNPSVGSVNEKKLVMVALLEQPRKDTREFQNRVPITVCNMVGRPIERCRDYGLVLLPGINVMAEVDDRGGGDNTGDDDDQTAAI